MNLMILVPGLDFMLMPLKNHGPKVTKCTHTLQKSYQIYFFNHSSNLTRAGLALLGILWVAMAL